MSHGAGSRRMARPRRPASRRPSPTRRRPAGPPQVVAVDGPSGAGKSSAARQLARLLGWRVFETGALYRAVAWAVLREGLDPADREAVEALCRRLPIRLVPVRQQLDAGSVATWRPHVGGSLLNNQLRSERVSSAASLVAAFPGVRAQLLTHQQQLLRRGRIVMEGRDIGTVVCPDAPVKFYLDADPAVRGGRRHREEAATGESAAATTSAIEERDRRDLGRGVAPLRVAEDAVRIDTTTLTLDEVVDKMRAALVTRGISSTFRRFRQHSAPRSTRS